MEHSETHTFFVNMKINGRFIAEIPANSIDEAKEKAEQAFVDADFGDLTDVDGNIVNIEDENRKFVFEA